nr:signal peptidase I [uncultured bacterium]BAH90542.1 signal peptidase I [uncultured bacterium]
MPDKLITLWRDWRGFVLFIAIMLIFRSAIADWNQVPSGSMQPTILIGDRIVVDKLAYDLRIPFTLRRLARWHEPERGDVVTFPSPKDEQLLVKRIVGIPGDVVSLRNNELTINGVTASYATLEGEAVPVGSVSGPRGCRFLRESILGDERMIMLEPPSLASGVTSFGPVTVPDGEYLMLGDNRDNSHDSRYIGFVARERILGRAETVAFSLDYDNYYRPRSDRFFAPLAGNGLSAEGANGS